MTEDKRNDRDSAGGLHPIMAGVPTPLDELVDVGVYGDGLTVLGEVECVESALWQSVAPRPPHRQAADSPVVSMKAGGD